MEIITTPDPMGTILSQEQGKQIYKLHLNMRKLRNGSLHLHEGHEALVLKAISSGAEVIIIEFFDLMFFGFPFRNTDEIYNETDVRNFCESHPYLADKINYIIYDDNDLKSVDTTVTQLINQRYAIEDYETKLNIQFPNIFKRVMYVPTFRNHTGFTVVKCWKEGAAELGYKHYAKKYLNIDTEFVNPVFYPGTTIPMIESLNIDENQEYRNVYTAFNNLSSADMKVKERLMEIKDSLAPGFDIVNFVVVRNSNLIPVNKALISCRFVNSVTELNVPITAFIDD